jgi:hypothetical protein
MSIDYETRNNLRDLGDQFYAYRRMRERQEDERRTAQDREHLYLENRLTELEDRLNVQTSLLVRTLGAIVGALGRDGADVWALAMGCESHSPERLAQDLEQLVRGLEDLRKECAEILAQDCEED